MREIYQEIQQVCTKIRLTPSTKFLSFFLAKNFLLVKIEKDKLEVDFEDMCVVTHCALLLAAKMRERDIYCPMISHMRIAGERGLT